MPVSIGAVVLSSIGLAGLVLPSTRRSGWYVGEESCKVIRTMMAKEELHALVDRLADPAVAEALDYLRWLEVPVETLSEEEFIAARRGEEEIARGEYVTLAELTRSLRE